MISTKNKTQTTTFIPGPEGKLEIALDEPIGKEKDALGIVCHPHSLHGGTMQNKVVTAIAKAFQTLGVLTVRFNFRGVGKSNGDFTNGVGELEDLIYVMNWIRHQQGYKDIWLGGFSFGAYVAAKAASQEAGIKKLVTVAPPVTHFQMETLPPITCTWILVQGDLDEIVSPNEVYAWAKSRNPKPQIIRFPEAGHFFHGQVVELRERLVEKLR
jgi:uncharacterized protein